MGVRGRRGGRGVGRAEDEGEEEDREEKGRKCGGGGEWSADVCGNEKSEGDSYEADGSHFECGEEGAGDREKGAAEEEGRVLLGGVMMVMMMMMVMIMMIMMMGVVVVDMLMMMRRRRMGRMGRKRKKCINNWCRIRVRGRGRHRRSRNCGRIRVDINSILCL